MQKRITRLIALLTAFLIMGVLLVTDPLPVLAQDGPPAEEAIAQPSQPTDIPIPPFVPGVILVGLAGDAAGVSAASAPTWGDVEVLAVEPLDVRTSAVSAAGEVGAPLTGYKLTVPVGTEWGAIETLAARGDVVFAEPDWLAQIAQDDSDAAVAEIPFAISDTLYRDQWYMQRIGMSRAWALALEESGGVLATVQVYIIDTGADFTHPDLAGKLATGRNYLSNSATAQDDNGHGTHVAGLVAAAADGSGMVGPGLQVEIVPFKALNASGVGGVSAIGQAIRDAADQGADIINLSLELSVDTFALRSAIQYAVAEGSMIIAASGNQERVDTATQKGVSYPAAYLSVLAVGATSYFDARAYYSNQGVDLDMVAPGGLTANSILSTWTHDMGARCIKGRREVNGGIYCQVEGTSMATGIVSGVAALIMSLRPDLDADAVQEILLETAAPINGSATQVGRGRLDAAMAIRMALEPRLLFDETRAQVSAFAGQDAFVVTLPLSNPSLEPLHVQVAETMTTTWYSLVGPRAGETSYGSPLTLQLLFTPTTSGALQSSLRVSVTEPSGTTSIYFINPRLDVYPTVVGGSRMFLAWLSAPTGAFEWAEPNFTPRTNYAIADDGAIVVNLPFSITVNADTVNERVYHDLRIFADGFVVGSASAFPANAPNLCLANQTWPSFAVYGWWSNLSLAAGSALSTFQPDADTFVIEYASFATAGSSDPDDRVSFQIVLHRNGQIELNYGETPEHAPVDLTVGASVEDGRFYNQITCHIDGVTRVGEVPQSNQSFRFTTEDLY